MGYFTERTKIKSLRMKLNISTLTFHVHKEQKQLLVKQNTTKT